MKNGGLVRIRTDMADDPNIPGSGQKTVKVTVRDTGEGFNEKALSHLFTPFFTTKEGGSGLGLAIVKRIVEGLKGEVFGNNHPDGGAEITIFFPPFRGNTLPPSHGNTFPETSARSFRTSPLVERM